VILAILTTVALTVLHWVQRRSAITGQEAPSVSVLSSKRPANGAGTLNIWKADYEQFLQ